MIRLVEVGPRDGLQNQRSTVVPLEAKLAFIDALAAAGLTEIEAGAFVHPAKVPQMADSDELFTRLKRRPDVEYSALIANMTGLERALKARVPKIAVFTAASEAFSRRNINGSIAESIARLRPVLRGAGAAGIKLRGYVSTAFWCPYEGRIPPERAIDACLRLRDLGVAELSVCDTIGRASPDEVRALLEGLLKRVPASDVFLHLHYTYGMAVANALCAFHEFGVTGFDASAGGIGGCPLAPRTSGNVATEDLLYALKASGAEVPAEPLSVARAALGMEKHLAQPLISRLAALARGMTRIG